MLLLFYWCTTKGIDIPIQLYVHIMVHMCISYCVRLFIIYLLICIETHYINNFNIQKERMYDPLDSALDYPSRSLLTSGGCGCR
jgi:uncharacterized membrane protein